MKQRIQKILSQHAVASRRKAETLLLQGRVKVNGAVARLGDSADDALDRIEVDGRPLTRKPPLTYIMLHKPRGFVATMDDEKGRRQVTDLVAGCGQRVYPIGRLDMDSEGLLLLTNDGRLANGLMHPKREVDKVYLAWVQSYAPGLEQALRQPMTLDDGYTVRPAKVDLLQADGQTALLRITIHEGRNRQIRKMCQQAGLQVTRLRRIAEGPVTLGNLAKGQWRPLTSAEIAALKKEAGADDRRL